MIADICRPNTLQKTSWFFLNDFRVEFLILEHCEGLEAALQGGLQAVNGGYNIEAGQAGQDASYQPFQVNIIV